MAIIFPGISTHSGSTDATTTKRVQCVADQLEVCKGIKSKQGKRNQELLEYVLYLDGRTPGPLEWRRFIERKCGADAELLDALEAAHSILLRAHTVGVEPDAVAKLHKTIDVIERTMGNEPARGRGRLRWLCEDMILRITSETDETRIGNIDLHAIYEAAGLAVLLGFERAPIQWTAYHRDGESTVEPIVGEMSIDPPSWMFIEYDHPEYLHVFGYRVHDPRDKSGEVDIRTSIIAVENGTDPDKSRICTPGADVSRAGAHDDALATAEWPNAEFVVLNTASAPETTIMLMACATFRFIVFSPCVMLSTEWQVRFQRSAPSPIGLSPTLRMATVLDALACFAFHRFLNS